MVRNRDEVVERLRKVRQKLSKRLLKARAEGRELEELRKIEREGSAWFRNGSPNGGRGNGRR
jgi:hypothetical protein